MSVKVLTGLERIANGDPAAVQAVRGRRIGLVAHPASVTSAFVHAKDVLVAAGANVRVLFGRAEATVEFAGLISPGLFQLNVLLPDDLPAGDAEVLIAIGGVRSRAGVIVPVR